VLAMNYLPGTKRILTGTLVAIALALLVVKTFFVGFFRVPQNGMYPGLPAGSRVFAAYHAYSDASKVKRGDIVVFIREENGQRYNYIWRVVALPGETVVASGDSLRINGQNAQRQRIRDADGKTIFREQVAEASYEVALDSAAHHTPPEVSMTVPPGQFFVMSDNRFDARDSRYFGSISFASIVGKKL
jgi:signal peptidase I